MKDCVFCKIVAGELPSWTVYEDDDVMAFFDISVASLGHTLVIPKQHYENIYDIPEKLLAKVAVVAKKLALHYREVLGVEHVQIVQSNGKHAQQDVFHYHMHVIPRAKDDDIGYTYVGHPELTAQYDELVKKLRMGPEQ